jgi:hypothetical protein
MIIDRLLPQVRVLARSGLGWEDVMVRLRIDACNMHIVRREVLGMSNADHQRESESGRHGSLPRLRSRPLAAEAGEAEIGAAEQAVLRDDPSGAFTLAGRASVHSDER